MANSTGNPINLPSNRVADVGVASMPSIQVAQPESGAKGLFSIANILGDVSSHIQKRLDIAAQVEGHKQGQIAGMGDGLPKLMDETTIRGAAFNESARDSAATKLSLESSLLLSEYEEKYKADPAGYKREVDAHIKGKVGELNGFDPAIAQKYEANFLLRADMGLQRVKERQQSIIRDQMTENALKLQMTASEEIGVNAQGLFSGGSENVQKNLEALTGNVARIADVAHQIGPDGRPLFSAAQRVAFVEDAQKTAASRVASAWIAGQPDMLTAWQTWKNGGAEIAIADPVRQQSVRMKLKDVLGERFYNNAQSAFMDQLKGQLAFESQVATAQERNFKKSSDMLFTDFTSKAQDGTLDLPSIEAAKTLLEPDKYLSLRSLAKSGGAAVSDGAALTRLSIADVEGQNVTAELRTAYDEGKLTRADYIQLYERNTGRLSQGQRDPISQGRDLVTGSLGKLSTELGLAQSVLISEAESDYALRVDDLIRSKRRDLKTGEADITPRDLTLRETLDVAKQVRERYSLMAGEKAMMSFDLPRFMTASQKYSKNFGAKDVNDIAKKTYEFYLNKNSGDVKALKADKEYQAESLLIKKYMDALAFKEGTTNGGNGQQ